MIKIILDNWKIKKYISACTVNIKNAFPVSYNILNSSNRYAQQQIALRPTPTH